MARTTAVLPAANRARARQLLEQFALTDLFIDELGWDRYRGDLRFTVDGHEYTLQGVAQKRGMVVFTCSPGQGGTIASSRVRHDIEHQVEKAIHEHLIIFANADRTHQVWQWVRKEPGRPIARREHHYHRGQPGDSLLQKLQGMAFSLEEESLSITDVTSRVRAAFDVERVTKQFYNQFEAQHENLLSFLSGIPDADLQRWYASVLLNRLMFLYFVQKRGLLGGDADYLRRQLERAGSAGEDRYYRTFLCPLFFEGLAQRPRDRAPATQALLGDVPYLNGGLFQHHQIEERFGTSIQIPDKAFAQLFDFFDQYQWHLDERPLRTDNEINPDVLGYIFEKYINQKEFGAYYTKEDITEYIGRASIIPYLLDKVGKQQREVWAFTRDLLRNDPERYIHPSIRHGIDQQLLDEIAAGRQNPQRRGAWNHPTPEEYGLRGEIWRETIARRTRYVEMVEALRQGSMETPSDLITANIDLQQLTQDLVEQTPSPALLLSVWQVLKQLSIIDPTCGSGAFLFAALNILEPLYDACLERMEQLVVEAREGNGSTSEISTFIETLSQVASHPNRRYFILKSIIVNNLFGVDIMEEAVEICRLRLFLKLVAQIDDANQIEPLPDIDFNIRAGNTLVGFATYEEVERAVTSDGGGQLKLLFDDRMERIEAHAREVDALFTQFRQDQTAAAENTDAGSKQRLQERLSALKAELDQYLASEYGVTAKNEQAYQKWLTSHQPFHWFVEFYGILKQGGFAIIIGNPPYVRYTQVDDDYTVRGYSTEPANNLYALTMERALTLLRQGGRCGMIVPIASVSTDGMATLQQLYKPYAQWHSHYAVRPGKLFVGVDMNLTISLFHKTAAPDQSYTTGYRRWSSGTQSDRPFIFSTLRYVRNPLFPDHNNPYPKLGSELEVSILRRMLEPGRKLRQYTAPTGTTIYYHSGGRYWRKAILSKLSSHYKPVTVATEKAPIVFCLLNSQLFYWYWISNSNCMDVVNREVLDLPIFSLDAVTAAPFATLMDELLHAYTGNTSTRVRRGERIQVEEVNFDMQKAKPTIDKIDRLLARHYGFNDEELDFILNYDIKYRSGRDSEKD